MDAFVATVRDEPTLIDWLKTDVWRRGFDRGSLIRSDDYTNDRSIHVTQVRHDRGDRVGCEASVTGTRKQPYDTEVVFFRTGRAWAVEAVCSCPVGMYCKHGAAVILLMLEKLLPPRIAPPVAAAPVPAQLDHSVTSWLDKIQTAQQTAVSPPKKPTVEKRFLAFCLMQTTYYGQPPVWRFVLRVATFQKDGGFTISDTVAQADPSKPPKYMVPEDFIPASLYYQRRRKEGIWDEMGLTGDGWEDLLQATFATGRFYVSGSGDSEWIPARAGPDLPALPAWEMLADGSARPVLEFEDGVPRIILPTLPPRYLERDTGTIGLLSSHTPPNVLSSWTVGPRIPARQVAAITEKLQQLAPSLPLPQDVRTVQLPPVTPKPHLVIQKRLFGYRYSAREIICGRLFFQYPGGQPLPQIDPAAAQVHYEIREGIRYVQPRDPAFESDAESRLRLLNFIPLEQAIQPNLLTPEDRRVSVPDTAPDEMMEAWFDFLVSPALAAMRQDGWTVEIEPSTGLLIRDAGAFFPEIEPETSHGIEWFRFDAKFEIDGKKLNLIPYIAEAIRRNIPPIGSPGFPEFLIFPCERPEEGSIRFPAGPLMEMVDQVRHLFSSHQGDGPVRIDRLGAAVVAHSLALNDSETLRSLAKLASNLLNISSIENIPLPRKVTAKLRDYQAEGFRWLQFLTANSLHGILADDMGLGKTVQTLAHLAAESAKKPRKPSLVIAPTSVAPNWAAEAEKFTPHLTVVLLQGKERGDSYKRIAKADLVITSYPLVTRDFEILSAQEWHVCVLDEAQYIKNPNSIVAKNVCQFRASHRLCLSGTPMENHLGELWSLMRFLMPGFLGDEKSFNTHLRRPIERDRSSTAQISLNRRVAPLILRRTKDQVATELPPKTELIHPITLARKQTDLYESVRAAMDKRVREAIAAQGLAKSHIIVLDALLKLRQICCHPLLLKTPAARKITDSAKLLYLTDELLPTLLEEGRRILLFSSFTSMLELIEAHLQEARIPFLKLTGQTQDRASLVKKFQSGDVPIFLISLKAGGTGLNLTAADTVIHYDPWWNPAAENQATDRAHRIGQTKPVFVHKLVCTGTIEERILELQKHKSALVEALLSEETSKLRIDPETLSHLLAPLEQP
ncbi:DEAD/DEAH box helicase [Luteolibacter yonseiensis]|uniref:DEAD/DEAH box helicase n=1 Tax=Luteolibacter yonseiensis TaxID=1144680 RepID=A0A934R1T1_9BACT|nr:DEAD/DEAH box helicase [Luteolibacter yonseiensis]MBK1814877.1 DEAD/DEAH box helicase [Luteolibacter yonseiensis]